MTVATAVKRVNLGSGQFPLEGWTNVDAYCDADVREDFLNPALRFRYLDEVRMSHVLEHISWRNTESLLRRVRSWMRPAGKITIEVPDMDAILALGTSHPLWFKYVYGDQSHEGEYHRAGFTATELAAHLDYAGWWNIDVERFVSNHKGREGMPCLFAKALA